DDDQAKRINLVDNRANDLATYDNRALLEFTADLDTLEGTGYDPAELDDIRAAEEETTTALGEVGGTYTPDDDDDDTVRTRKGMQEKYDAYENTDTRQIVLAYTGETYIWMVEQLGELGEAYGVESNAAVVQRLVAQATGAEPPA